MRSNCRGVKAPLLGKGGVGCAKYSGSDHEGCKKIYDGRLWIFQVPDDNLWYSAWHLFSGGNTKHFVVDLDCIYSIHSLDAL